MVTARKIIGIESWPFTLEEEGASLKELEVLSDRAAGIVATTLLENSLDSALHYELINDDPGLLKELFSEAGPLGSFAAKIKMAYALGLVTKVGRSDLDKIRRIRNAFAHRLTDSTFQSDSIKDRCLGLQLVDQFVSVEDGWSRSTAPSAANTTPTTFIFPEADPAFLKDPRSRFFLTINHFVSTMLLRSPRSPQPRPYF